MGHPKLPSPGSGAASCHAIHVGRFGRILTHGVGVEGTPARIPALQPRNVGTPPASSAASR